MVSGRGGMASVPCSSGVLAGRRSSARAPAASSRAGLRGTAGAPSIRILPAPEGSGMAPIARRPLLGGLAALAAAARPTGAQPVEGNSTRLGALFPFTGPLALLGDEHFRGL